MTLVDRYIAKLKNNQVIAVALVFAALVIGVAQFTDAASKIRSSVTSLFKHSVDLPNIPGGSGWILLGDLERNGEKFIRGPFYKIYKSSYLDKSLVPRKGEQLQLTVEREVVIPGYKETGLTKQFDAPWTLNVLSESDYTGTKLPKHGVVEVRDVSLGSFPDQPVVVWARVAAPPR